MLCCVRLLRRPLAVVLIPLVALGCYSWQTAKVTPQVLVETEHPKAVRVTTVDSVQTKVAGPRIAGDTLRGTVVSPSAWGKTRRDSVAVALRDVTRVEVRRYDSGRTLALIFVSALIVGAVAYAISESMEDFSLSSSP